MNYEDYFKKLEESPEYQKAEQELKVILDLADDVLRLRMEKGWSQAELAEHAMTKQANISRLESGLSNPSVKFLEKLARALETNLFIRFERAQLPEVDLTTDAGSRTQEAIQIYNWPVSEIPSYDKSSPTST